ncbi:hypothetical protein ABB37_09289 [Leptomonas pyrrhocoris]|uniref:EF-hand domain-containing protein n=1 Tax=Leptomonas pyrrhocoris TaxID=157538 RepID=A0A0N1J490_LEPPY|nr:hypothetical protein ABB37_09289 [Leptomonas pyrrhocoris]KPA74294.1 hypothetical protein ABB37_09289 [Leptomonas pyrrhocoris]|eukprot:XP_015652733.1 hypothetical protein ABB37_09289 [Leptomonas pyrrhocoris]
MPTDNATAAAAAAVERQGTASTNEENASFAMLVPTAERSVASPTSPRAPTSTFQSPLRGHPSQGESRTSALRRHITPSTLLSEVLNDPLFQLLNPTHAAAGPAAATAARKVNSQETSLLTSAMLSSTRAACSPDSHSPTSPSVKESAEPSSVKANPQEVALVLPSSHVPPPSMLLMALADMDVLQQSFYAHTSVWPAKAQLSEFKKLVAASMKAELARGAFLNEGQAVKDTRSERTGAAAHSGDDDKKAAAARQAHDVAVRTALYSAHGFLHGTEAVPTGVPRAHLQRARQKWVRQYRSACVQRRLEKVQRYRYEVWRLQHGPNTRRGEQVPREGSVTPVSPAVAPATTCAALKPPYWRETPVDLPAGTEPADAEAVPSRGDALRNAAERRRRLLSPSANAFGVAAATASEEAAVMTAAWEMDLYDDLQLVLTAHMSGPAADEAALSSAMETSGSYLHGDTAYSTGATGLLASEGGSGGTTAADLLRPPADLTQMQLPLPVFVYVMSRYLFLAHYAVHFPPGLFSSALINPFYFPDSAQCTAAYALRAVPVLRREAEVVRANYALQLADAHSCFPERVQSMEVPLPPDDALHLWELLCPPQQQDRAGRWQPVPWGQLLPDEEDALLETEYASPVSAAGGGRAALLSPAALGHQERPLLGFAYGRAARRGYRDRLQQLAQHPVLLAEVQRLLTMCEEVAMRFFATVDTEQRGCISWEDLTGALIEEADIQDHQLKVREHAAQLTRASASVFDRYVVEPLAPEVVRLGYTGAVFEVRHSASLVMLEGVADYAVCDGTQLGSIHQRFLVRPVEVVLKELEAVPRDAFGRPLRSAGAFADGDGGGEGAELKGGGGKGGAKGGGGGAADGGYDAALRQHPWRNNQRPVRAFMRYEDGRRLQESTALSVLQQLSGSDPAEDDLNGFSSSAYGRKGPTGDGESSPLVRMHQPAKPVALRAVMAVEDVSSYVPWTVFVVLGNDMLLRLYSSNRAVQALPEAGLLRCAETVTCMEWAAGGSHGKVKLLEKDTPLAGPSASSPAEGPASATGTTPSSAATPTSPSRPLSRLSIQRQEYLILGTRSGALCLVDLYAVLHKVPRLTAIPTPAAPSPGLSAVHQSDSSGSNGGGGGTDGAGGTGKPTSERIGSSSSAWSGYRALAQRTYYSHIDPFVLHERQVHAPGTLVCSVVAAASNGLFVSSGLDGDVFTMRLGYPGYTAASSPHNRAGRGLFPAARPGVTAINLDGTTTTTAERPLLCIEVLHRLTVSETGVRYALPIPSLSMLAVQTVSSKVYLYHTSVLPTAAPVVDGGRAAGTGGRGERALTASPPPLPPLSPSSSSPAAAANPPSSSSRLELYDAASPHLGAMVAVIAVEELDQLLTVDSTGYVKVWGLRQTLPLTSFYAVAPVQAANASEPVLGQSTAVGESRGGGGGDGARNPASSTQGGATGAAGSDTNSGNGKENRGLASSLLRTTKHSIEAAVDATESRLQPCLSAAYNYASRQLYVMGSNNAALCFFMSGQSSARAHTNPLRALLIDTASKGRGQLHRRLISFSSADCRVWSLRTGAMELGIRASNAEYRHLFDHRITGRPDGVATRRSKLEGNGDEGVGGAVRSRSNKNARNATSAVTASTATTALALASLTALASTTGEARRLLPRSVEDVMRAVSARPSNARPRARSLRGAALSGAVGGGSLRAASAGVARGNPNPPKTAKAGGNPPAPAPRPNGRADLSAFAAGEVDDTDLLLPSALRDHNVLTSDIRCACLGPDGQWIGYALLHGEIRLHRTDSGRLLHTFITTPPSMTELLQAALHYEHLFALSSTSSSAPSPAASTSTPFAWSTSALEAAPAKVNSAAAANGNRSARAAPVLSKSGAAGATATAAGAAKAPYASPRSKLTPVAYAQAVAVVLQRLLASLKTGQRFGSFSASSRAGAASSSAAAASGAAASGGGGVMAESGSRDVHREPLSMFYVEASQELFVVYADGLVRVFTLLGHRTTATRVIVSRTLVNRALEQVRRVLDRQWQSPQASLSRMMALADGKAGAGEAPNAPLQLRHPHQSVSLQELLMTGAITSAGLTDVDVGTAGADASAFQTGRGVAPSTSPPQRGASTLLADATNTLEGTAGTRGRASASPTSTTVIADAALTCSPAPIAAAGAPDGLFLVAAASSAAASAMPRQLEPDVVLLASASPPLGLICLVHASGLVTVMDVQASGDDPLAGLGSRFASDGDGVEKPFFGAASAAASGGGAAEGGDGVGDSSRSQSGVVVHSFMTTDEVTAATFLGAYPCLVLADRQRTLSFHLVKGASMLAMLGDFAERLRRDATQLLGGGALTKLSPGASATGMGRGSAAQSPSSSSTSSTLIWTTPIDETCASVHVLGSVTVLAFDPLYAALYVGTSQGYIMSYLVRRLLLAFQLTPVFLRGVDGVAVTSYATALQRRGCRHPLTLSDPHAAAAARKGADGGHVNFLRNLVHVFFGVAPASVRERLAGGVPLGDEAAPAATAPLPLSYDAHGSALLHFYEAQQELFRPSSTADAGSNASPGGALLTALQRSPATLFTAAAVLHDAVTRMHAAAAMRRSTGERQSGSSSRSDKVATSVEVHDTQPWWDTVAGGGLVREYVTQQCGAAGELSVCGDGAAYASAEGHRGSSVAAGIVDPESSLADTVLELDGDAVRLLREWICSAVVVAAAPDASLTVGFADAGQSSTGQQPGRSNSSANSSASGTLPPLSATQSATGPRPSDAAADAVAAATVPVPRLSKMNEAPPTATTPRSIADALVQEVEEELLFGDTAPALCERRGSQPYAATAAVDTLAGRHGRHPVTEGWVEPLFTRHAVAMASRSPLCLLTPPAMLERSRRERLDRQARRTAAELRLVSATAGAADAAPASEKASGGAQVEWDAYVEGAPPDYLADMLSRPGQVLPEAERQALRQRTITALQCRRNGYLCVGHADGGVTLWTPYACGRLESLCPSTSLPASLERLSQSVRLHFEYVHERIVLERRRRAFEGAVHNRSHNEQEGKAHMKQRIRKLLLDHHLSQLHLEADDGDTRGRDFREVRRMSVANVQPPAGVWEGELLTMRPLLCLLLGIASPAELRAHQLSLEDLCFLPLRMESIASLEAFKAECYMEAVEMAVQRLRRELTEADDASPTATAAPRRGDGGVDSQLVPSRLGAPATSTTAASAYLLSRSASLTAGRLRQISITSATTAVTSAVRCVYDYPLSRLAQVLNAPFHPYGSPGLTTFPGAVRLLLHRALEGAPLHAGTGRLSRVSLTHVHQAGAAPNAANASTTTTAAAAANGPAEGEYFEVCHALQLAEVHAETQWEMGELHRLWTRLQRAEDPVRVRLDFSVSASSRSGRRGDAEDSVEDSSVRLPPGSAAAVSAAVHRQLLRELEGRLTALSQRTSAGSLLLHVGLQLRSGGDVRGTNSADSSCAFAFARRTPGSGLAWVQATMQQQSLFAFAEPRLQLPAPSLRRPPAAGTTTKLRAAAVVSEARRCWPLSATDAAAAAAPPLSSFAPTAAVLDVSPISSTSLASVASAPAPTVTLCHPLPIEEAHDHDDHHNLVAGLGTAAAEGAVNSEASFPNKSSTVPAAFLTEINADVLMADSNVSDDQRPVSPLQAVFREFEQRRTRHDTSSFTGASASSLPPRSMTLLRQPHELRAGPLVPRHRTTLARTGSSPLVRARQDGAASAGPYRPWRALPMGYSAGVVGAAAVPAEGKRSLPSPSPPPPPHAKTTMRRGPTPNSSHACVSLLGRSGTTK